MKKTFLSILALAFLAQGASLSAEETAKGFQAHLIPFKEATLASRNSGMITHLSVRNGSSFKKGDILVSFDCKILRSEREKAEADLEIADATYRSNLELQELRSISELEVNVARAEVHKAEALLGIVKAQMGFCNVYAPYAGRVVKLLAHAYESVEVGDDLMEIVGSNTPELRLFVPSHLITKVPAGTPFIVNVRENHKEYAARVVRIGGKIDPISQTVEVYGRFRNSHNELVPGMSGVARFTQ